MNCTECGRKYEVHLKYQVTGYGFTVPMVVYWCPNCHDEVMKMGMEYDPFKTIVQIRHELEEK